jgi:hypothetical protein
VKPARAGGNPDLARRGVPVDDDLRGVVELDLEDAGGLLLEIDVDTLERLLEGFERGRRLRFKIGFVHGVA